MYTRGPRSAALAGRSVGSAAVRAGSARAAAPTTVPHPPLADAGQPETPAGLLRQQHPLSRADAWLLAGAILAVFVIGYAVEPEPNGPEPVEPLWVDLVAGVTVLAALGALGALLAVQRAGAWLAAATGGGLVVLAATCPMSGHHVVGGYTYVQLALSTGLLAVSMLVLTIRGRPAD